MEHVARRTKPAAVTERGRALYNTRNRRVTAIRRHLVGLGVPGVGTENRGPWKNVTVSGFHTQVVENLRRVFDQHGRLRTIEKWKKDDPRPYVVFCVPTFAEDPEEIMAVMSIDTFARLLTRGDPS
jgi:hypothetical protein